MHKAIVVGALLGVLLVFGGQADAARRGESHAAQMTPCNRWAYLLATSDKVYDVPYVMHKRGCTQRYGGAWTVDEGRCMLIAYRFAVDGLRGRVFNVTVGAHGCVLYEDGAWGDE